MDKKHLINFISNSQYIKNKTTFKEQLKLIEWVKGLSEKEFKSLINEVEIETPKPNNLVKKVLGMGFAAASLALPGGLTLYAAAKYLMNTYNWKCELQCQHDKDEENKSLCSKRCISGSLRNVVSRLEKDLKSCDSSNNPVECRKKLLPLLKDYRMRLNSIQTKLSYDIRKAKMRGEM